MTLREFIRQEIKKGHVRNLNELRTKVRCLEWEDGEEIDLRLFMEYLDYDIDCYLVIPAIRPHSYEISMSRMAERIKKSQREGK